MARRNDRFLQRRPPRRSLRQRALFRKPETKETKPRLIFGTGDRPKPGAHLPQNTSRRRMQKRLRRIQEARLRPRRGRLPGDEEDPDVKSRIRRGYQNDLMAENAREEARLRKRGEAGAAVTGVTLPGSPSRQESFQPVGTGRQPATETDHDVVITAATAAATSRSATLETPPDNWEKLEEIPENGNPKGGKAAAAGTGPVPGLSDHSIRPQSGGDAPHRSAPASVPGVLPVKRPSGKLRHTVENAARQQMRQGQDDNDALKASQQAEDRTREVLTRQVQDRSIRQSRLRERSRRGENVRRRAGEGIPEDTRSFWRRRQKRSQIREGRSRLFGSSATAEGGITGGTLLRRLLPGEGNDGMSRLFRWMLLILLLILILSMLTSGLLLTVSSGNGVVLTTYPNSDEDIYDAENGYRRLEQALEADLTTISLQYPGYEEYIMDIDTVGHDPYVLISYLNTVHWNFTVEDVEEEMEDLFRDQYVLTVTPGTRQRNGQNIRVLYVHMENRGLETVVRERMDEEQTELYDALMVTKGNRDYLFNASNTAFLSDAGISYRVPEEALSDEQFARMLREAEKYLGWPYVWGGSSPSDGGFDCSGYVCWVVNHCGNGWNVGRTTAEGLRRMCAYVKPSEAKPGDLVFFENTYNTEGASHIGIYVGNGMMINAGDPIKYADITTPYWQQHFMQFGRLPGANPGTASDNGGNGWTEEDRRLLADCIYWEARGQSFECQCYVGQVILNRVYDRRYPNTVRGVIGQPGQYANGIRSSPDPCYAAADAVLSGQVAMPRNVIYQAQFTQGSGVWKYLEGEYFCYG